MIVVMNQRLYVSSARGEHTLLLTWLGSVGCNTPQMLGL